MSRSKALERAREEAESLMNLVGAEKVVSVAEDWESSIVTVWFREGGYVRDSKEVMPEV